MAMPANPPTKPTVNRQFSSLSSVFIEWTEGVSGDIPVQGYKLYMIEILTGQVTLEYDGSRNPDIFSHSVQNLQTAAKYSFYAVSVDFNGQSSESEEAELIVCLRPDHIDRPDYVESTKTSITVRWNRPTYTGGCPILTYRLWMDAGLTGTFLDTDSSQILNKPYLTEHTITGLLLTGDYYDIKIEVVNDIGSAVSLPLRVKLAAVPDTPSDLIQQDFDQTSKLQISLSYLGLTEAQNGGSELLGYELWRDDGKLGDFKNLYFTNTILALTYTDTNVQVSLPYRYKYRARNISGWGDFSEPSVLFAADRPG
jgi:hypothetical protein